jgi:hypothetical protein
VETEGPVLTNHMHTENNMQHGEKAPEIKSTYEDVLAPLTFFVVSPPH